MTQLRLIVIAAILSTLLAGIQPACAVNSQFKTVETASAQEVVEGMSRKLVRGAANTALGWLELPRQIYEVSHDMGIGWGVTVGPLKGAGMAAVRTVCGVAEAVTFFFPLPGFYDQYIEPEFVWQKW